jgi:hypothetical protein
VVVRPDSPILRAGGGFEESGGGRFERDSVRGDEMAGRLAGVIVREIGVREGGVGEVWGDSPTLATFRRESVREMRESARERRERRESNMSISSRRESALSTISSPSSRRDSRRESIASSRDRAGSSSGNETATSPPPPPNSSKNKVVEKKGGLRPLSLGTQEVRARRWRDAMEELRKM